MSSAEGGVNNHYLKCPQIDLKGDYTAHETAPEISDLCLKQMKVCSHIENIQNEGAEATNNQHFIILYFSILLHCIVLWVLQVMSPSACRYILCWFPLSFTTCFGLHGHLQVCKNFHIFIFNKQTTTIKNKQTNALATKRQQRKTAQEQNTNGKHAEYDHVKKIWQQTKKAAKQNP
jgi:hypothetical protein